MSLLPTLQRSPGKLFRAYRYTTATASLAATSVQTSTKIGQKTASPATSEPVSSCLPNTVLEGLNYLKGQPPVMALLDEEYPPWLWTTLKPKVYEDDGPGGKAEQVQRRLENKRRIKDRNFMSTQ